MRAKGKTGGAAADPKLVHISLLAGLLSHIGLWDTEKRQYVGARGAQFALWPGSALAKKHPTWVMAGELVETSRLWGRDVARIEPDWAEPLAAHLLKRTFSEPHWSMKRGAVMAYERVTLYGVPLVAARRINYGRIDQALARELFIRHALVQGEWRTHHKFFHENRALLEQLEELEDRVRRRDLIVDENTLYDFYDQRVPSSVVSTRDFDAWWKSVRGEQPELLNFSAAMLLTDNAQVDAADYPDLWEEGDLRLRLTYQFEPGSAADGVTVHVPLPVFNRFTGRGLDWQVPGLRLQLITALLKSLPKPIRRHLVPVPDTAAALLARLNAEAYAEPVLEVLTRELRLSPGITVPRDAWNPSSIADHLRVTYLIEGEQGEVLARGKDLEAIRRRLATEVERRVSEAASSIERNGLHDWSFGSLPATFEETRDGHAIRGFPALVEDPTGRSVAIRVLASLAEQQRAMWLGTRRLLSLTLPSPLKSVVSRLDVQTKLALAHNPHGSVPALLDDCVSAVLDELMRKHDGPVWDEDAFRDLQRKVRPELPDRVYDVVVLTARILTTSRELQEQLAALPEATLGPSISDVRHQLADLIYAGFVTATGVDRLADLQRYLTAARHRVTVLPTRRLRDQQLSAEVAAALAAFDQLLAQLPPSRHQDLEVLDIRWMIEELRVSLFAQHVRTAYPISGARISRTIERLATP